MSKTNLSAKVEAPKADRIPAPYSGLQYNFCKNPKCPNYGIEPHSLSSRGSAGMYTRTYGGKNYPLLRCNACSEAPPLKSNVGITEELSRISAYLNYVRPEKAITCPNIDCQNHTVPVMVKEAYRSFGAAKSGSKRYQCKLCLKTVSIPKSTCWQHDTSNNIQIFKDLVAKAPFNRIVHKHEISWSVFYNRIDFIHRQCMAFAAGRGKS